MTFDDVTSEAYGNSSKSLHFLPEMSKLQVSWSLLAFICLITGRM